MVTLGPPPANPPPPGPCRGGIKFPISILDKRMRPLKLVTYETLIVVGVVVVIGALLKILGILDFSSDWFWLLAGSGLSIDGIISLIKQKKFDRKYKIIEKEE
jgi:hypothetical protein